MSTINHGESAFPAEEYDHTGQLVGYTAGMTLRDYFAAKALPALIANFEACLVDQKQGPELCIANNVGGTPDSIAEDAYAIADAMLRAREAK